MRRLRNWLERPVWNGRSQKMRASPVGRFQSVRHRNACIREYVTALLVMYQQLGIL